MTTDDAGPEPERDAREAEAGRHAAAREAWARECRAAGGDEGLAELLDEEFPDSEEPAAD